MMTFSIVSTIVAFEIRVNFSFWWCSEADEISLKEETWATIWCFPFEQPEEIKMCLMIGNPANEVAIFAKSY